MINSLEKKLKKIISILTIILFAWAIPANAQFNKAGRTALQFLKIGVGARQAGLGEAVIANMNDVNSTFWNPAAITGMKNFEAGFTFTNWIADLNIMSGAVGVNLGEYGAVGFNYISLDYGEIPEAYVTSPTGSVDTRIGTTFGGGDLAVGFTYAKKFTDKLSIGMQVKYLREELYKYSTSLWAFDVGSYYETGWKGIRIAMSAQNFSSQARWLNTKEEEQQSYEIPIIYRIGFSIDLLGGQDLFLGGNAEQHKVTVNVDAIHSNDYAERLNMGMEYTAYDLITLRTGYRVNYDEGNFSIGFGAKYKQGVIDLKFDYAYVLYDFLESPHRFSVIMAF